MSESSEELSEQIADLKTEVVALRKELHKRDRSSRDLYRGIRKRSATRILGMPLYDIAVGPDPEKGERKGHARGFFAYGDIATGVFAAGGFARGIFAFGGLAVGVITFGGASAGLLLAMGGAAIGGIAIGGAAAGGVAIGAASFGYYALGSGAAGKHVFSTVIQDPIATEFFSRWLPGFAENIQKLPPAQP